MTSIEQRDIERTGFCRGCDIQLEKGTPIIYTYSHRNRGQSIIFCLDCGELIGDLSIRMEPGDVLSDGSE